MQKMQECFRSNKLTAFLAIFILAGDQLSKFVIVNSLRIGDSISVLPFFNIVRVENKGITFGFLSETLQPMLIVLFSLAVIIYLCLWTRHNASYRLPAYVIVGGAVGNMIDRFTHRAVIDFLDFHLLDYHWPAFNVADSAIVIGVIVLCCVSYEKG